MIIEKYTLDMLTQNSVSVKTQKYYVDNGTEYVMGTPHRKAYMNDIYGREDVQNELPQAQQDAIFSVWGEKPTVQLM